MPFLKLMPTGGLSIESFVQYLKVGAVAVGLGSAFYANDKNYLTITKKAELVIEKIKTYTQNSNHTSFQKRLN